MATDETSVYNPPTEEKISNIFLSLNMRKSKPLNKNKCLELANKFYDYYQNRSWNDSGGNPIKNINGLASSWLDTQITKWNREYFEDGNTYHDEFDTETYNKYAQRSGGDLKKDMDYLQRENDIQKISKLDTEKVMNIIKEGQEQN